MFLTFGVMIVWSKKKSDGKEMKKAYCGFSVALRRPWKSREKKLNGCISSGELPDPIQYFNRFRAEDPVLQSSTSVVEEKCHDGSGNVCKE